jgi:hypothetical protein
MKLSLGKPKRKWKDNIKEELMEMVSEDDHAQGWLIVLNC